MPELTQRLGFDLTDALPRDVVQASDFLQSVAVAIDQTEPHFEDRPLTCAETGQHSVQLLFEQAVSGTGRRVFRALVLDEITHAYIPILPHRRVERDGLARHLQQRVDSS